MKLFAEAPLTNLQLEIPKAFKAKLHKEEILEVADILSAYLTNRAITLADNV